MGFQNKPQNISAKKMQRKTSEMMEGSGIEIFIIGLNGPSNEKANNHKDEDDDDQ